MYRCLELLGFQWTISEGLADYSCCSSPRSFLYIDSVVLLGIVVYDFIKKFKSKKLKLPTFNLRSLHWWPPVLSFVVDQNFVLFSRYDLHFIFA